ncbi:MAG: amidohydrolase [Chloroflexi bacterium]|nr:amidohydrolase [Chloroflexota bacterium]
MVTIDIHAHVLTEDMMARLGEADAVHAPRLEERQAEQATLVVGTFRFPAFPRGGWDVARRLADMDATGVAVQALSVVPFTYLYELEPALGATFSRIQNDAIAALVRDHPTRFVGLATLPLQDPLVAADELRRACGELGLRGFAMGTNVAGRNLDDPALAPVWAAAAEVGAFVFVHPQSVAAAERLGRYYLINLIGNPLDTSIAAASLVFGGVLERHPRLTVCLAHGGGFVPYQRGRWEHGWRVRAEPRQSLRRDPAASLNRFLYDTILHSPAALEYLVQTAGADRVLLGSDYPFDMGPSDPVAAVRGAVRGAAQQQAILGNTAAGLLGM